MATRTAYIKQDVMSLVKDAGNREFLEDQIVRVMDDVQKDLCRKAMALKFEGTLTMIVGQETYDVNGNVEKIVEVIEPDSWETELTVLHDAHVWKEKRRTTTFGTAQPLYVWIWNRWAHVWPLPTVAAEEVGIIGVGLPLAALAEDADPEIDARWDEALKLGTVARIAPGLQDADGNSYKTLYRNEWKSVAAGEVKESIAGPLVKQHSSSTLGF